MSLEHKRPIGLPHFGEDPGAVNNAITELKIRITQCYTKNDWTLTEELNRQNEEGDVAYTTRLRNILHTCSYVGMN